MPPSKWSVAAMWPFLRSGDWVSRRLAGMRAADIAREGGKFVVAGGIASAVNWLTRLGFSFVVSFPVALAIGATVGMTIGFTLYRAWVFPGSTRRLDAQTVLFLLVNAVTASFVIGASVVIAALLADLPLSVRNQQNLAHAVAIGLGAFISFVGHRSLTFARRAP